MKVIKKNLIIVTLLFILSTCNNSINADRLEFYILRSVEGSYEFIIDEKPIFTGDDILSYEWKTHTITFKEEFIELHDISETEDDIMMGGSKILGVYYPDQFAVYLDGEELYRGYINPQAFISFMPMGPTMLNSNDGITIRCIDKNSDTMENEELREFLKSNELLR